MTLTNEDRATLVQANLDMQKDETIDDAHEVMGRVLAKYGFDASKHDPWSFHDKLVKV